MISNPKGNAWFDEDGGNENGDICNGIPGTIVHGRYDIATPFANAWALHKVWHDGELTVVPDAGHTAVEPGIARALVVATQKFRNADRI